MLEPSNMHTSTDDMLFKQAYNYKTSLVVCQIFNRLFLKLHYNHFGAPPPSQLYICASMQVVKQIDKKCITLLAASIVS